MESIIACPNCGKRFKVNSQTVGSQVKCAGCHVAFLARSLGPAPTAPSNAVPPVPTANDPYAIPQSPPSVSSIFNFRV